MKKWRKELLQTVLKMVNIFLKIVNLHVVPENIKMCVYIYILCVLEIYIYRPFVHPLEHQIEKSASHPEISEASRKNPKKNVVKFNPKGNFLTPVTCTIGVY